jgi:quercetin dioxygenase-like cupin family protein
VLETPEEKMKKTSFALLVLCCAAALTLGYAQTGQAPKAAPSPAMPVVGSQNLQWMPFMPGIETAVLSGDPSKAGEVFNIRIRTADGAKIPPHWHPTDEHVTVLKGSLAVGMGEKWDANGLKTVLTVGNYIVVPKGMRHFALSKGETIVQVHGMGPFQINFVNPADDPNNQAKAKAPAKK